MGTFKVEAHLRNWQNRYLPVEQQGEDVTVEAMVDTGAAELALPADVVELLKLEQVDRRRFRTADGAYHEYRVVGIVEVTVQGRSCQVRAVELPRGATPLLGAVPLEEMDWHISPFERRLVPNPESPDGQPVLPLY